MSLHESQDSYFAQAPGDLFSSKFPSPPEFDFMSDHEDDQPFSVKRKRTRLTPSPPRPKSKEHKIQRYNLPDFSTELPPFGFGDPEPATDFFGFSRSRGFAKKNYAEDDVSDE